MKNGAQKKVQQVIRLLTTAAANAALYNPEHRQVLRFNKQALAALQELLDIHGHLTLKLIDGQLIHDNLPVEQNLSVDRLLNTMNRLGISYLQINSGIYGEELLGLVTLFSKSNLDEASPVNSDHIKFGRVEIRYRQPDVMENVSLSLSQIADHEADRIMELYQDARNHRKVDMSGINEIVTGFVSSFNQQGEAFLALAPLRAIDEYTYTHSTNICLLNLAQARALGIEGQLLNDIGVAAMLHDVGKMFISPEILGKSGELSEEEWAIMQQHPRLGAEYLLNSPGVPKLAVITAFEHHMRYDGIGYPKTSQPWKQHPCSFMTAISDTYDAMRTRRAYEESLDLNEIISIMLKLAGNKLHPQLTYNFLNILTQLDQPDLPPQG